MTWLCPVGDDEDRTCGYARAGHGPATTRQLLELFHLLASDGADWDDVVGAWFATGSVHRCRMGGDPTGEYQRAFDGETFRSDYLTHYCPDDGCVLEHEHNWDATDFDDCRCSDTCPGDGADLDLIDPQPVTVAVVDWDRWDRIEDRRFRESVQRTLARYAGIVSRLAAT